MRFVIITGMSGAGKTQVMHSLEDMGYYCIDNLPVAFLLPFAKMCNSESEKFKNVAVVVDIRGGEALSEIGEALQSFVENNISYEILFLEADESVIVKRYKETRRKHPLSPEGSIEEGILLERDKLSFLRGNATNIIDTSPLLTRELKQMIRELYGDDENSDYFRIQVQSFGFKYGIPRDTDLIFDVRFLPNPFYIPELKEHNGTEKEVSDFVLKFDQTKEFVTKLEDMLTMLIPHYIEEGKTELVIGIGCTGGKHRSVAITEKIVSGLNKRNFKTIVRHRDMHKD
ncbi:MAG: RNase adapter RapZ [Ruminococcaceae bacterium]|nr:RNase adapter RapZ [Oscillospiraceae bacterium]